AKPRFEPCFSHVCTGIRPVAHLFRSARNELFDARPNRFCFERLATKIFHRAAAFSTWQDKHTYFENCWKCGAPNQIINAPLCVSRAGVSVAGDAQRFELVETGKIRECSQKWTEL